MGRLVGERTLVEDVTDNVNDILAGDYIVYDVAPNDARRVRTGLGMSQAEFAAAYGFPLRTLQDWEQGRREPDASARSYLAVIERMPKQVRAALKKSA